MQPLPTDKIQKVKSTKGRIKRTQTQLKNPRTAIPVAMLLLAAVSGGLARWFSGSWITALIIVLAVALVVLVFALLWMALSGERSERSERGIDDEGAVAEQRSGAEAAASLAALEETFTRGIEELKHSKLGGDVHALPWVLVIGERGSGKTTALQASGLEIPAEYSRAG